MGASLTQWRTPQALGISDQAPQTEVPLDDQWNVWARMGMLVMVLTLRSWMRPFGAGRRE
jgi:hypothetical protein